MTTPARLASLDTVSMTIKEPPIIAAGPSVKLPVPLTVRLPQNIASLRTNFPATWTLPVI